MNINIGKVAKFVVEHAGVGVKLAQSIGRLIKGSDKKAAVQDIIADALATAGDLTDDERALAIVPEVREAIDAIIDAKVAVMKAERELRDVIDAIKRRHAV